MHLPPGTHGGTFSVQPLSRLLVSSIREERARPSGSLNTRGFEMLREAKPCKIGDINVRPLIDALLVLLDHVYDVDTYGLARARHATPSIQSGPEVQEKIG